MISEKGALKETPVMKLLLGIFEQALTGILYVKNEEILKVLYFNRGKLIWAISNSNEDKLENILAARDLVDPNTLLRIKREAHVSESIGKVLVEKGLITLEELIESSKIQLKRIIISLLKWKTGGFQFVKDAPPERLLSLDLNITNFIIDFILDEMDIGNIWKEIGSLQIELIKNPDEEKLNKYRLSEKQMILLNSFSGKDKLETVLSRYSGGHRESLLKIIYFFLMAELLIKKEFDLADSSAFDENKGFDYFHPEEPEPEKKNPGKKAVKKTPDISQSLVFEAGEKEADFIASMAGDDHTDMNDDKLKKIKMASLILVIFIFIIGGIILLILPRVNEVPLEKLKPIADKGSPGDKLIEVEERKPEIQEIVKPGTGAQPETGAAPAVEEVNKQENNEASNKENNKSAMAYFQEGSMITAGDIWKQELINAGIKYSILLELDCQKESVIGAYNRLDNKDGFFILNKPTPERTCFLVLWGKYRTQKDAKADLETLPRYFWQQPNPPGVVEVTKYL